MGGSMLTATIASPTALLTSTSSAESRLAFTYITNVRRRIASTRSISTALGTPPTCRSRRSPTGASVIAPRKNVPRVTRIQATTFTSDQTEIASAVPACAESAGSGIALTSTPPQEFNPINANPPYNLTPDEITKAMLEHNVAPSYDQITCMIAEGDVIPVHDPAWFDQAEVAQKGELDRAALTTLSKLTAPLLVYHVDVIGVFDRLWQDALKNHGERFRASLLLDNPALDLQDEKVIERVARTSMSIAVMAEAMAHCHAYSAHFIGLRIKLGVELGLTSAITRLPDLDEKGQPAISLISVHGVENKLGDERLYVDLFRP